MTVKRSKQLTLEQRKKFYGWYINFGYNKRMNFEQFLSPTMMAVFLAERLHENL